ncbi:MAG TPA: cytochrome C oxidase subunit IV family protein [Lacipirellulaceae bacterium]|nr:cytochrome C oxidase subunit IV family protein [Lacipirellulaceae bacterium]HMP05620.1 cytochrome C oxidase subunit IV family protein [Lacipirellulaceae bacterium]
MTNASTTNDSHNSHDAGHGGVGVYVAVAIALVFLTACSYWTYTPLWPFGDNVPVKRLWMMAVSCTKAMLVILFFMHLKWEANWKWILTVPASLMSLLLVLALVPDVGLRFVDTPISRPSRQRLTHAAERQGTLPNPPATHDLPAAAPHAGH